MKILYMKVCVSFVAVVLLSACAQQSTNLYYWGDYENLIYKSYVKPGELSISEQIQLLNSDIDRAKETNKKIAPGLHAHLGYLYFVDGNANAAVEAFNREKTLYPESEHFLNGMIERMRQGGKQ